MGASHFRTGEAFGRQIIADAEKYGNRIYERGKLVL